jgi:putative flippase GtrA
MAMAGRISRASISFTTFYIWWAAMTFQLDSATLLHWALQPLVALMLMLFHWAVVDLLIQTHYMDWLGRCQEVLEGKLKKFCIHFIWWWREYLTIAKNIYTVIDRIRYTPESSNDPENRQPLAFEVWQSVRKQLGTGDKITLLTSGPLTNLANISLSDRDASSVVEVSLILLYFSNNGCDSSSTASTSLFPPSEKNM